jgi:protein required for attachment to host cells
MKNQTSKQQSWVLVANSSSARLFRLDTINSLSEFHAFVHPESRMKEQDLTDSQAGRTYDSVGPGRHAMEPHSTQKQREVELFAKSISTYLDEAQKDSSFSRLYIAAGPAFLSCLRKALSTQVSELIEKEISKDLVHAENEHILNELID